MSTTAAARFDGVAKDGKCLLNKVLAPAPAATTTAAVGAGSSVISTGARAVAHVKRLDGTIEEDGALRGVVYAGDAEMGARGAGAKTRVGDFVATR